MNYFGTHVNLNLNSQYWLQFRNHKNITKQRKPVGVFWDIENCSIPRGMNASVLVEKIRSIYATFDLIENEFVVVCDVYGVNNNIITELNNMQVNVIHVCSFSKNACDEKLKQLMIRFVNTHGHNCVIILFSSDINFAPVLTDIKNRIGAFVILFHHQQVSPALLAGSNYNYNYSAFCASIPDHYKFTGYGKSDQTSTTLSISNLPRQQDESQIRTLLNRITGNAGGRIINVNAENAEANVLFKCKSDAVRCHQRVNNRRFYGHTLKAKIDSKMSQNPNLPYNRNANNCDQFRCIKPTISPEILQANTCTVCKLQKQSEHTNFLLKEQIFMVHISMEKLSKKLNHLLDMHSGKMPFNSLPDCWLKNFNEELDCQTEPKVLLEHLVCCVAGITIKNDEIEVKKQKFQVKYILREDQTTDDQKNLNLNYSLVEFSSHIKTLLENVSVEADTMFPSIRIKDFENLYRIHFKKNLNYQITDCGCSNLLELLSLVKNKYNLYSYGAELVLAYNMAEQVTRFIEDLNLKLNIIEDEIESLDNFDIEFDPSFYGFCYKDDLIQALFDHQPVSDAESLLSLKRIFITKYPFSQHHTTIKEFRRMVPKLKQMLMSLPDFSIELKEFHANFQEMLQTKFDVFQFSYPQAFDLILNYPGKDFEIIGHEHGTVFLTLNESLRMAEIGKRMVLIFNEIVTIMFEKYDECNLAISIYQLLYHYQEQYLFLDMETESVSKFFEKILVHFLKNLKSNRNYCLIYTASDTFLFQFEESWRQEIVCRLFLILFFEPTKSINFEHLKHLFLKRFGFAFSISFMAEILETMEDFFKISRIEGRKELMVELGSKHEFETMCLTVMLTHEKMVFTGGQQPEWTVEQLETEIYDHFGISISYQNIGVGIGEKFDPFLLDYLFEVNVASNTIRFKRKDIISAADLDNLPTCNYCGKKDQPTAFCDRIKFKNSTDFFILQQCC